MGTPSSTRLAWMIWDSSAAICTASLLLPKKGNSPGIHTNGLLSSWTILPKARTNGQSFITWYDALPNEDPSSEMHESLTNVPFPVSNFVGFTAVENRSIMSFENPCSMKALSEHRSLPAPLSAIHSICWISLWAERADNAWWFDKRAGAQCKVSLTLTSPGIWGMMSLTPPLL